MAILSARLARHLRFQSVNLTACGADISFCSLGCFGKHLNAGYRFESNEIKLFPVTIFRIRETP